jgi:hypothetical protein
MQNNLTSHMRVFVNGDTSVESLSIAAMGETVDRQTASKVLTLIIGWERSTASMSALRERVRTLI